MTQKTWHSRVIEAVEALGTSRDWILLDPCVIYLQAPDDRIVSYRPDCVWTAGRENLNMVIWEVENAPSPKSVAGDIALAAMCRTRRALIFPYEHKLGSNLRKPFVFRGINDRRLKKTVEPEEKVRLPFAHKVSLVMVFRGQDDRLYYGRYLDVIADRYPHPFAYHAATWCSAASVTSARKSLSKNKDIRRLEDV
ncbi:MAG TPA: hypothetical protein VJN63_01525 [Thermoplasmata archaeon]|nr:hypothetical protein [Thermoplasmata archaeon]